MDLGDSILASLSTVSSCYNAYFGLNLSSDWPDSTLTAEGDPPDKNWKKIVSSGLHFASMVGSFCPLPLRLSQGLNLGTSLLSLGTNVSDIYERRSYYQEHKLEMAAALFQAGLSVYYALNTTGPQLKAHNEAGLPKDRIRVPHFPDEAAPPHRTPELVAKVVGGRRFERMVVIVHQRTDLEEETTRFLNENPELNGAPRVLLSSFIRVIRDAESRVLKGDTSESLKRELSIIAYSGEGYLKDSNLTLLAEEIHLMGGYYQACFSRAVADLVSQFCNTGQTQLRLRIHRGLTYYGPSRRTLAEHDVENTTAMKWLLDTYYGTSSLHLKPVIPLARSDSWQGVVGRSNEYVCDLVDGKKLFVAFDS